MNAKERRYLGIIMLAFYKTCQGIGESPVRNEFDAER